MMMMNWDDLKIVAAVNRTRSFTRAGRLLGIDETTVARRIARIETQFSVTLFDAVHGLREPTPECRAVLGQLAVMETAAAAIRATLELGPNEAHRLRLSTISAIAENYLTPGLPALLAAEPRLLLSIDTDNNNVDMSRWEADFAIRLGRPRHGTFVMRRIGALSFALIRPVHSSGATVVSYPPSLHDTPEMRALLAIDGLPPARLETADLGVMLRFLRTGAGLGVLPELLARQLIDNSAVIIEPMKVERDIWLLTQPHLRDDPLARVVSDWCAARFA